MGGGLSSTQSQSETPTRFINLNTDAHDNDDRGARVAELALGGGGGRAGGGAAGNSVAVGGCGRLWVAVGGCRNSQRKRPKEKARPGLVPRNGTSRAQFSM